MSSVPVTRPDSPPLPVPGFYGKLPAKGDFVARRLPRGFIDPWDHWLQTAIETSRAQLGDAWRDAYLGGPVWRFVVPAGHCGDLSMAGVMMPSVDRVGRHFPLTVGAPLPSDIVPIDVPLLAADWFELIEELALSALGDGFDFDGFDRAVEDAGPAPGSDSGFHREAPPPAAVADDLSRGVRQAIGPDGDPWPTYPHLLHAVLAASIGRYGLWWTAGNATLEGSLVVCATLPAADRFAALLDGDWSRWGWQRPAAAGAPVMVADDV